MKSEKSQKPLLRDLLVAVSLNDAQTYQEMTCQLLYVFSNLLDGNPQYLEC